MNVVIWWSQEELFLSAIFLILTVSIIVWIAVEMVQLSFQHVIGSEIWFIPK